ncbi:T9SS type A sorting domain-containing protein [Candidatus Latescibacterota bacterium]
MKFINNVILIFIIFLILTGISYSSGNEISGSVSNGTASIPFATVRIKATSNYTITDFNGRFTLKGISSSDTLVVTAWADGYYNGQSLAKVGDSNIEIILHTLFLKDNPDYEWISPEPNPSDEMRCGNCHADVLMNQWRNNAHGNSSNNPFFLAMYNGTDINGNPSSGVGYKLDFVNTRGNCATCHIPGAAANNPWGVDPNEVTGASSHGVFCDFCHKIQRVKSSTGQGTTGVLSIELLRPPDGEQIFFGPFDDIHEPDAYLPLIRKSDFCAPCHTGKFWGTEAYNCFPEWKASPYPSMGIECQTCHMSPDRETTHFVKPEKGGIKRDPLTIPSHLQPGSRDPNILANSVTMNVSAEQYQDSLKVIVTVKNDKTGHHVPTGRPSRNMILLVEAKDSTSMPLTFINGDTVPWWGGKGDSKNGNFAGKPGKGFAKILEDFEGHAPSPAWRPSSILSDNRIAAFETDTSYYNFKIPSEIQSINISAKLVYRRFFKEWMDEKKFDIADITMEDESIEFTSNPVSSVESVSSKPVSYWLGQNYPNPFNALTTIQFHLPEPQNVQIILYSIDGQKISTVVNDFYERGTHSIQYDFSSFSSGVYLYHLRAGKFGAHKKLLFIR